MELTKQQINKFKKAEEFTKEFKKDFNARCNKIQEFIVYECVTDGRFDTSTYVMMETDFKDVVEFGFFETYDFKLKKDVKYYDSICGFPEEGLGHEPDYESPIIFLPINYLWLTNIEIKKDFLKNYEKYMRVECFKK